MGNEALKPNVSFTQSNETENSTSSALSFNLPGYRDKIYEGVARPIAAGLTIITISLILSVLMIVVIARRLHRDYALLQNIFVVDLVAVVMASPMWLFGMLFEPLGLAVPDVCRAEGFFILSLQTVFLWTVTAIAIDQLLSVLAPFRYGQLISTPLVRGAFLLSLWTGSGLLCASPLNAGSILSWGLYSQLGHICWVAWVPTSDAVLSFAVFHTVLTLVPAILTSALALVFVHRKVNAAVQPEEIHGKTDHRTPRTKPEVLHITSALLLIFFALWLPLSVIQPNFAGKNWDRGRRLEAFYLQYFLFGRGILNFSVSMVISARLRAVFVDVIFRCKCATSGENPAQDAHVETG